jgi:DNA sulfur modification protein DndD
VIIEKLELENFGPFYGRAEIQLGGGGRPIVVVHGDNMAGKTSILNAIRWALYGVARDRLKNELPTKKLINRDAFDERQFRVSVKLHISTDGGSSYILRRQKRSRRPDQEPLSEDQFEEYLDIDHDGNVVHASEFGDIVAELLPEGISRFFLFDGELLEEYEELVREGGQVGAARVKDSIEMILGVPAATKARDDLEALSAEVSRKLRTEAKHSEALQEATSKAEKLEAERAEIKDDLQDLKRQHTEANIELVSLEDTLKESGQLMEDAGKLKELRERVRELDDDAKRKREERKRKASDLWRDALAPTLRHKVAHLSEERNEAWATLGRLRESESRLRQLLAAGEHDTCPQCGQSLPAEALERVKEETRRVQAAVSDLREVADEERVERLTAIIERLRQVAPANVAQVIATLEGDLKQIATRKYKARQEIEKLEERLRDQDPEKALEYQQKRNHFTRLVEKLKLRIDGREKDLSDKERELDVATRQIAQHQVPALKTLSRQLELVKDVEGIVLESLDDLIRALRASVEAEATDIFKQITTDPEYSGLRINDQYGLTIIDGKGRDVEVRSAGAEQVVALSLIGALNRLAVKRGPVIMDTPFGRLDPKHRAKILQFIPTLSDQVVLLVHEGEVDSQRDLDPIANRIARKYEILHPSSTRSEVVLAKGVASNA